MKLLIAEDDATTRVALRGRIAKWGYEVVTASSGREALQMLLGEEPPRIAILDWMMPEMDGPEICSQLERENGYPFIYRILLSGKETKKDCLHALEKGAHDFQSKPIDFEILQARIQVGKRLVEAHDRLQEYAAQMEELAKMQYQTAREMEALAESRAEEFVRADKMAALGKLSAGMAHEVKTPIGNAATTISFLDEKTRGIYDLFQKNAMKRSHLEAFFQTLTESLAISRSNLERANAMMESFKTIAVDQCSEKQRPFHLRRYLDDILLSLRPKLKKTKHRILIDCPEDLMLNSFPGAFSQILTNFINNSLLHAYDEGEEGTMRIAVTTDDHTLTLTYQDDGKGIPPEILPKIFDRFFTTKLGQGGSGLGLDIVRDIVQNTLKGQVVCRSEVGKGTEFEVTIPLSLPSPSPAPSTS